MDFFKPRRVTQYEYHSEDLIFHLEQLSKTETRIYQLHESKNFSEILSEAEIRERMAQELSMQLTELVKDKESMINGPVHPRFVDAVEIDLKEILRIVRLQIEELKKSEVLVNDTKRLKALDGAKTVENESALTTQIKKTIELLRQQSGVIAKYVIEVEQEVEQIKQNASSNLIEVYEDTYEKALKKVSDKRRIYTMEEIFSVRLQDSKLFNQWFTSCYSIVYGQNGKFKLVKDIQKNQLLLTGDYICKNYDEITGAGVYEYSLTSGVWNKSLKPEEVLSHQFYKDLFKDHEELLKKYVDYYYSNCNKKEAMGIYISESIKGEWRALYVDDDDSNSFLVGNYGFINNVRFLLRP